MTEEQLNQLKSAVELSPDNVVLLKMYFNGLKALHKWNEAEEIISNLNKLEPSVEHQVEFAQVLYHLNKISQGVLILENALASDSNNMEAYKLIILLYYKENDENTAYKYYKRLKRIDPDFSDEEIDELFSSEDDNSSEDDKIRLLSAPEKITPIIPLEKPDVSFDDVGGMQSVKEDISMKIINPIKHADLFKQYGKKIGGGILLYGPPGCGKTHIAKATAGEIDSAFISVGINEVMDMYLGQSEKQLHEIFDFARNNTPAVIFFDEVDALGASRNDMRGSAGKNVINQFLQELDGINASNDGILVLGATNAPWHIDNAFKRPGRFDRIIFIPPPDAIARKEILEIQLKDKPKMEVDIEKVANKAVNFTGADLKSLVDYTIEEKLKVILKSGKETPIKTKDFLSAIKKIRPSSMEWFETARNYAVYSNQGGQYDDIKTFLNIK
ncbi:AAA family ATPase [Labilibacter marinus]|uniref:AAA family ATPase n=1 Tax=Labilibacter marinus TaxID=1477105 RepID=UPI0008324CB2|nr:AAA family ATPase [Labilibacter marinus]